MRFPGALTPRSFYIKWIAPLSERNIMSMKVFDTSIRPAAGSHLEQALALASRLDNLEATDGSPAEPQTGISRATRTAPRGNVLAGAGHHDASAAALETIAQTVSRTLGPHGSNTLIRDSAGGHLATKDGYTVLQRLTFVQETATMVLDHVRAVSRTIVRKVGDGSTTAVVMANALYSRLSSSRVLDHFPPGSIQAAVSVVAEDVAEGIRRVARPLAEADILTVATVAANNNPQHGALVAQAYAMHGRDTNVFVMEGSDEETVVRAEPGYRVLRGMVDDCFANRVGLDGATATSCLLQDAVVMIVGEVVSQTVFNLVVAPAMNESIQAGHAFVLVAKDYDSAVRRTVSEFVRRSPGIRLLMLDHATATRRGTARLGDLAAVLGATVLIGAADRSQPASLPDLLRACGYADAVRATGSETVFVVAQRHPAADERLVELEAQLARVDENNVAENMADELDELRARRRAILGSEVTILAGGSTHLERQALVHLLDDAALAVKSAMRSGVVEGLALTSLREMRAGNIGGAETARRVKERTRLPEHEALRLTQTVVGAFAQAYREVARVVLENSRIENPDSVIDTCLDRHVTFNAVTLDFSPLEESTVINPADTDAEIARGAASIVSLFVASNQTVLTHPLVGGDQD